MHQLISHSEVGTDKRAPAPGWADMPCLPQVSGGAWRQPSCRSGSGMQEGPLLHGQRLLLFPQTIILSQGLGKNKSVLSFPLNPH